MTRIAIERSAFKRTSMPQYVSRFAFGGVVTLVASLIDRHWGPIIGGLFLAFPGIFPCGASLVEAHAEQRKRKAGLHGAQRGRQEASLEAAGASSGALGLAAFAAVVWWGAALHSFWVVLPLALAAWCLTTAAAWWIREWL